VFDEGVLGDSKLADAFTLMKVGERT
jgi:hypothetical protein